MPQKIPGIGEDVSHLFEGSGGTAIGDDVSHLFGAEPSLPRRPVSAEDFAPPRASKGWPATIGDFATGLFKGVPAAFEFAKDAAMAGTGDVRALQRTGERLVGAAGAQGEQFRKASQAIHHEGRRATIADAIQAQGYVAAGMLPFVGPAAASAGEAIGRGDTAEGLGEATALLAPLGASTALPYAGRAASAAGRGAQAIAGHPLARAAARKAAEATPYIGPIIRDAQIKGAIADLAAEVRAGRAAPKAPTGPAVMPEPTPARMGYGRESGRMGFGYEPEPAAPPVRVEPPPGTRLVRPEQAAVEPEIAAMLDEVRASEPVRPPPARITTPPQAELPAGYTPRTNVPKPKPAKAELPAAHPARKAAEAKAAKTKQASFTPEEVARAKARLAERESAVESVPQTIDLQQLPTSWRTRTDQPIARLTKAEVSSMADSMLAEGIDPAEAMSAVTQNPNLPPQLRTELMTALQKIAKRNR
jgi:hypothetical protein